MISSIKRHFPFWGFQFKLNILVGKTSEYGTGSQCNPMLAGPDKRLWKIILLFKWAILPFFLARHKAITRTELVCTVRVKNNSCWMWSQGSHLFTVRSEPTILHCRTQHFQIIGKATIFVPKVSRSRHIRIKYNISYLWNITMSANDILLKDHYVGQWQYRNISMLDSEILLDHQYDGYWRTTETSAWRRLNVLLTHQYVGQWRNTDTSVCWTVT